jgi:hypothetical protein
LAVLPERTRARSGAVSHSAVAGEGLVGAALTVALEDPAAMTLIAAAETAIQRRMGLLPSGDSLR